MAQTEKERKAMWWKFHNLSNKDKTILSIHAGQEPKHRPDIHTTPISMINPQVRRKLLKHLKEGSLNMKVPFKNEIMGIQNDSDDNVKSWSIEFVNSIGDVIHKDFDTLEKAQVFKDILKRKGYKNHQKDINHISIDEFNKRKREGKLKGYVEVDRNVNSEFPELNYVAIERI